MGICPIGGATFEHEATIAIAALDKPGFVIDMKIDPRVAERGIDHPGAIAQSARGLDADRFGRGKTGHKPDPSNAGAGLQSWRVDDRNLEIISGQRKGAGVSPVFLIRPDEYLAADADEEDLAGRC